MNLFRSVYRFYPIVLLVLSILFPPRLLAQRSALSTNVLYWGLCTANVQASFRTGEHTTLGLSVGYNPFRLPDRIGSSGVSVNPKMMHWSVSPEYRHWFCRPYERLYVGVHGLGGRYNVGGLGLFRTLSERRYSGWGAGCGIGIGYQWPLGGRWGLNLGLGVGYLYLRYSRYVAGACGDFEGRFSRHYIGPTKAEVSFVFLIR